MFEIQFDAAGIYLVGTQTEQFHVSFEEMISFTGGIIGLLEYGVTWKVIVAVLGRVRHRLWRRRGMPLGARSSVCVDNSGPVLYEIRHGIETIRISPQELESSRFGKAIKEFWDGGMVEPGVGWTVRMVIEAFFVGLWRNILRTFKIKRLAF
ncbi:hypothetical protein N7456_003459 [Penicillium angulare]|uniref:Uncharacterized protein n=1 Tax=Penicillium angulare TaxID=116970 RepID=A0A9W9KHJ3_9EURO|nr:hypothetical protein N7456_003459 [Penicillium angulare]